MRAYRKKSTSQTQAQNRGLATITDIKKIQHRVVHFVLNKPWHKLSHDHDSIIEMLTNLGWPELEERRKIARLTLL